MQAGMLFFSYFCNMNMEEVIRQTVEVLQQGKTLLYPTDTIWGIGCNACNYDAVERLYSIKERSHTKSMLVLVERGKWNMENDERPTTYILPYSKWHDEMHIEVADNIPAADGSLGVRIPNHTFCQEVIHRLGAPLVSTSANLSGHPSPRNYNEIEEALKRRVDFCLPPYHELLSNETRGSRIVKINPDGTTEIIRP